MPFHRDLAELRTTHIFRILFGTALVGAMVAFAMQDSKATSVQVQTQVSGCAVQLNQQKVHIEPGQGIENGGRWAHCELYDGHPVVVYSNLDQGLVRRGE